MKKSTDSVFPAEIDPLIFYEDADIEHQPLLHAYYQYIINNRFQEANEYLNNSDLDFYGAWLLNLYEKRLRAIEENIEMVIGAKCKITTYYENEPTSYISMECRSWVGANEYDDNFYLYRLGVVNGDVPFSLTEAQAKNYMNIDDFNEVVPLIDISLDENRLIGTSGTGNLHTYDHYIFEYITNVVSDGTNHGYITNNTAPEWCPKVYLTQEFSDGIGADKLAIPYTLYYYKGDLSETNKIVKLGSVPRTVTYNSKKYNKDADYWTTVEGTIDVASKDSNYANYTEKNFLITIPNTSVKVYMGQEYHYQTTDWTKCSCKATLRVEKNYDNTTGTLSIKCHFTCVGSGDVFTVSRAVDVYLVQLNSIISDDIPSSMSVTPSETIVNDIGSSVQLFTTVYNQFGEPMNNQSVTYSSSDTSIATVSSSGKVTTIKRGNVIITASHGTLTATSSIQVGADPIPTSISISPMSILIDTVNGTEKITATVKDQYGEVIPDAVVTYISNIPTIASVSSTGVVTGLDVGAAGIRVYCGEILAVCSVSVQYKVDHIIVSPSTVTMEIGQTGVTLSALGYDKNNTVIPNLSFIWASSNTSVAAISDNNIIAFAEGSANITATYSDVVGTCNVTVKAPTIPTTLNITPTSKNFTKVNERQKLTIEVLDQYGQSIDNPTLNIYSTNTSIASVTSEGWITPNNNGNCSIVVECGNLRKTCSVTVEFAAVYLNIIPSSATITEPHGTVQLTTQFEDGDHSVVPSETCTWETNKSNVATVSSSGLVTAVSNGTAIIRAINSRRTLTNTSTITVNITYVPTTMTVSPTTKTFSNIGDTQQITTTVYDQTGSVISNPSITYRSGNTNIATVSNSGVITAVSAGNTTITVMCGTLSKAIDITVEAVPVATTMTVEPNSITLGSIGGTKQITATVYDQYGNIMSNPNVVYSSVNTNIATVSSNGLVTAKADGNTTINVVCSSLNKTVSVVISTTPVPTTIIPNTENITFYDDNDGSVQYINGKVYDQFENEMADQNIEYSINNSSVATLTTQTISGRIYGKVTVGNTGSAIITMTCGSATATCTVTVRALEVVSWTNGTLDQIITMVTKADHGKIDLTNYWHVGDKRQITLPAIIDNEYDLEDQPSQTVNLVLAAKDSKQTSVDNPCYNYSYYMPSSNIVRTYPSFIVSLEYPLSNKGSLNSSSDQDETYFSSTRRRLWLVDLFFEALGKTTKGTLGSIIKSVEFKSPMRRYPQTITSFSNRFFFPTVTEIYGKNKTTLNDGSAVPTAEIDNFCQWDIYANGLSNATSYWTRTLPPESTGFAVCNTPNTNPVRTESTQLSGILPCFCI